jgi:iron complex outermembrane recepter protein
MRTFLISILLGLSSIISAQQKISGIIKNIESKPIHNVIINIPEIHIETVSDINGNYSLNNLPKGNFKIVFSLKGYTTKTESITITDIESILNVTLGESMVHMDEVIVSTAFNKLQSQNVMKVEHYNLKALQQKGVTTLIDGLATIPGVSQVSTGTSIGKPVIRGLSGNRVLIYTQGVRLENQQFGEEHGLGMSDAGVESVEVIKGPASLLYGSDALGGVLYFNPEKFVKTNTAQSNFSQRLFLNTLGSSSSLGYKTSLENWKYIARATHNTHSDYKIPNGDRVTNTRYNETDIKTGVGFSNSAFSSVFRYNYNKLDIGIPENGITEQSNSKKTEFPSQGIDNHILSLNNIFYFEKSKLDLNLGYIFNDRKEYEENNIADLHMKLKTFNIDLKYHLPKIVGMESIFGIQGMNQSNANFGDKLLIPNAKTNDIGFFGTVNREWKTNSIQAGIRFDNRNIKTETHGISDQEGYFEGINKNFNSLNSSIGMKTGFTDNFTMRLNFASGFRAPNLAELTSNGVHEGSNRYEIGNQNLKNEKNIQTDINFEYKSTHFELFINGFYNQVNNYIFLAPNGDIIDDNNVYQYSQENANLFGGETGIHFHPHPLDWLHYTSSFENVTGKKQNGDYLPLIPSNKWNNNFRIEFKENAILKETFATLNIESYFSQNNIGNFETKTSGYTLLNLGFGGNITIRNSIFNLNLNANNLLNKKYISHLSRLKSDNIQNIGRNIILGISFNI